MFIKKISSLVLAGSLLLVCSSIAVAQEQAGQSARLKRFLALTETQVTGVSALMKKHRQAAFPLRQYARPESRAAESG